MKKIIIAFILVLSLIVALPSCNFGNQQSNPDFDLLNDLANKEYTSYDVSIVIENLDSTITENYSVTIEGGVKTVEYKIERYSTFEILPDETVSVPSDYITTEEGTLTTEEEGHYDLPKFNFSYDSLKNEVIIGNNFKATIVSLSSFIGSYMDVTDAKVTAEYTQSTLRNIVITFVTEAGQSVTVQYTFN